VKAPKKRRLVLPVPDISKPMCDRFGLETSWTILTDKPEVREAKMRALVSEVFATACHHLGEKCARELFLKVAKGKAGRPGGPQDTARDQDYLRRYDEKASSRPKGEHAFIAAEIADEEIKNAPSKKMSDKKQQKHDSVAHRVRDLVKNRAAESRAARRQMALRRKLGFTSILADGK